VMDPPQWIPGNIVSLEHGCVEQETPNQTRERTPFEHPLTPLPRSLTCMQSSGEVVKRAQVFGYDEAHNMLILKEVRTIRAHALLYACTRIHRHNT